ncbi:RNA polymerase sigma factor [Sunxiuqinia sp. A32]|uniref:RNA polymerase sigma factor n=1 Tax=Sunxiuqinia sp. A32 TaxID=3461496 RepID=UPI004045A4E5
MIDRSLNIDLRNGTPSSYEKLYSLTADRLKNYCKIFLKDHVLVEDMVQNAYVRLWEKRALIKQDKSVESFLFTIVRNQCLNYLRDEKLASDQFSIDEYTWSELQLLYQIDFSGEEDKLLEELLFEALNEAIKQLPERQNQVIVKCKIKGKKQQDVADELGISLKAVEKNLTKAKRNLRENLLSRFPELTFLIWILLK